MKLSFLKPLFGLSLVLVSSFGHSQSVIRPNAERCKSGVIHHQLMQNDPQYAARIQANENAIQQIVGSGVRTGGIYTIPVVVHVLHKGESVGTGTNISTAQIMSAIDNLNDCYSGSGSYPTDIEVQFQLAVRDPNCAATTGIVRVNASGVSDYNSNGITSANETTVKAFSKWPNSEYYNIWIVSEIDNNGGGSGTQGYAYFPGAGHTVDGAVILYNSFGYDPTGALGYNLKSYTRHNATTNHELGHAFNLYHTFEGDDADDDGNPDQCPVNTTCTTDGDKCCDTEAHNRDDGDCGATGTTCTGQSIATVVENIMAYSSDVCQVRFTADQKARIRASISVTRATLLTSPALLPVSTTEPAVSQTCSPQSTDLDNGFAMGVYGLTIGSTAYSSSGTEAEGGYRNHWCSNFNLAPSTLYSITVNNGSLNNEKVRVWIDYNNDGDFDDSGENVYTHSVSAKTHTGSFTTIASPVTGQPLWIRVISDFGNFTISGPCYVPTYGQVEDFSVTFSGGCTAPTITGTTPGSRCGTGTVNLGATASAGTLNWYSVSTGGSSLGSGSSFTTPSISSTTTYYVDATDGGCTSARTAVVATVNATPSVTSTTPGSRCGTGTVVLGAAASAGTLTWYSVSTGGTSLGTGTAFTTPSISSTTNYFVDATNSGCISARTSVSATINSTPSVTSSTPGSRCGTGTVVLGATASAGTLSWYAASTGGASLGTGTSFTTPSISTTTNYFVEAINNGCFSSRTSVSATVNPMPSITSTTPASRCGTGTLVLGATASTDTLNWYSASTGGTNLGSGTSFTTPSISSTTNYFVEATNGGCTSARTSVAATINSTPSITSTVPGSRCGTGTVVLGAAASAGTLSWYAASTGGTSLGTGTSFTTPSISTTTSYFVEAVNGACVSARTSVTATVNSAPSVTSTVPASRCGAGTLVLGATASTGILNWYSASTGGSSLGTGTFFTTPSISSTTNYFVDATNGGCTSARTAVLATINANPSLSSVMTQSTCSDDDGAINLTVVGGTPVYNYNWSNGSVTQDISGLAQGTYSVTVSDVNGCSSTHSNSVTQDCSSVPNTQLAASQCGQTLPDFSGYFHCNAIPNAQDYEWEFTNSALGYSFTKIRGVNYATIPKTWIAGLQYGITYNVRVRAKTGGIWGNFSTICSITIGNSIPNTEVSTNQCGQIISDFTGYFYCDAVSGAQDYEWEFTNSGLGYAYTKIRGVNYATIPKTWISGMQYGVSYNVRVRAKVGGVWGSYGPICTITVGSGIPNTQLTSSQCGQIISDLSGYFHCDAISGAQDYEWEFTNSGLGYSYTKIRGVGYATLPKNWIVGLQNGYSYNVRVKTKIGGVWGNYGPVCSITINTSMLAINEDQNRVMEENTNLDQSGSLLINAYPNPSGDAGFNVSVENLSEATNATIIVYDVLGKVVFSEIVNGQVNGTVTSINSDGSLPKGVYFLNVIVGERSENLKLIIK